MSEVRTVVDTIPLANSGFSNDSIHIFITSVESITTFASEVNIFKLEKNVTTY